MKTLFDIRRKKPDSADFAFTYLIGFEPNDEGVYPEINIDAETNKIIMNDGSGAKEVAIEQETISLSDETIENLKKSSWSKVKTLTGQDLLLPPDILNESNN